MASGDGYQIVLLVNSDIPPVGFSEKYFIEATDINDAIAKGKQIARARLRFLAQPWYIAAMRVGQVGTGKSRKDPTKFVLTTQSVQVCGLNLLSQNSVFSTGTPGDAIFARVFSRSSGRNVSKREWRAFPKDYISSTATFNKGMADGAVQTFARVLFGMNWKKIKCDKTTGVRTGFIYDCVETVDNRVKRTGRPFFLRRGRRFSHHA
jgi:hypothetical protein